MKMHCRAHRLNFCLDETTMIYVAVKMHFPKILMVNGTEIGELRYPKYMI